MKKFLYILSDIFIILFYAGAYLIQSFTRRKLGMLRWYNYNESKWKEMMPIEILRFVVPIIFVVLVLLLIRRYFKKKRIKLFSLCVMGVLIIMTVFYLFFTITQSPETIRSYYLGLPLIGLAALIQYLKALIVCLIAEKK